jgi:Fic-DOC domain mobile mystery protein B
MDLTLSPSEQAFREELRTWLAENHPGEDPSGDDAQFDHRRAWQRQLYDAGYAGFSWPKEYGGRGATLVEQALFGEEMARLIADCRYWIAHQTYPLDEIAARFHHRLTWINCFANGNGRHARVSTDLLLIQLGRPAFSWGQANLADPNATRKLYVTALRAADHHDIAPLLTFVRS